MAIVLSGTTGIDAGSLPVANTGKISAGAGLPAILNTAGVDRVTVDTTGNVGIETSNPLTRLHITSNNSPLAPGQPQFIISGNANKERMSIRSSSGGAVINVGNCGGTIESPSSVTGGMFLGSYQFGGYAGSAAAWNRGAQIAGYAAGNWSDTSLPADIVFQTVPSGSITLTERMRLDSNGNLGIGTSPNSKLHIAGTNQYEGMRLATSYSSAEAVTFIDTTNSSNIADSHIFFKHETDGSSIIAFGTTPAGSKSSDRRVERLVIDGNGNVLVTGSGGLGYGTGAGGIVTQLTSKSTAVTLNKPSGQITTNNSALAAGATAEFQFNNSLISSSDMVIASLNTSSYNVFTSVGYNGFCFIRVINNSGSSASSSLNVYFTVIKGAAA